MDLDLKPELLRVERPPQSGQDRPRRGRQPGQGREEREADALPVGGDRTAAPSSALQLPRDSVSISAAARVVAETGYAASPPPLSLSRLLLNSLLRRR